MERGAGSSTLLPPELLEAQVGQIDLLMAMYPTDGDVVLSDAAAATLDMLREALAGDRLAQVTPKLCEIDLVLSVQAAVSGRDEVPARTVQLSVAVPLAYDGGAVAAGDTPDDPPPARVRLQQPAWMSKAEVNALMAALPAEDDLFATVENIRAAVSTHLATVHDDELSSGAAGADTTTGQRQHSDEVLTRVWFYFPSISTRAKRDDLVDHAPSYGLTGFLLAGKPGILCLEGGSQAVDDYMRFIKTESWGDIPAHHKKVSERYRQPGIDARAFAGMQEITGELERRGERANRNDMRALEAWLGERGLQEAFAKVLI